MVQGISDSYYGLINAAFLEEEHFKGQDVGVLYLLTVHIALSVQKNAFCLVKER